jgi:hypothetical protein
VSQARKELKGGSRLRAKWVKGTDGSEIAAGLFDTQLGVDCRFGEAEDGKTRCLPAETAKHYWPDMPGYSVPINIFLDSGCTQRAAASSLCAPPLRYARFSDTCGSRDRIAPVTEVQVNTYYYRVAGTTSCTSAGAASLQMRFYRLESASPPTEFVEGNVTME